MCALGLKASSQLTDLASASREGQVAERFGGAEIGRDVEKSGSMTEKPALQGQRLCGQFQDIYGDVGACGSSSAAHRATAEDDLRSQPGDFAFPEGVFAPGKFRHLGKMLAEPRIPAFKQRQKLVANAIACEGEVAIGGVLAPGLVSSAKKCLDLSTSRSDDRANDSALGKFKDGMDSRETFGPRTAEKLGEHRFCLVVESVRSGDRIDNTVGHELPEPTVTEMARRLFDGAAGFFLGRCAYWWCGYPTRLSGGIDSRFVKGQPERGGQFASKFQVFVGLGTTQTVVEVSSVEDKTQFPAPFLECSQQGDGIRTAGQADGEAQAGPEHGGVQREHRKIASAHDMMILRLRRVAADRGDRGTTRSPCGNPYTYAMLETRIATVDDAELITRHRRAMFADAGNAPEEVLDAMCRSFDPWVRRMLSEGKYRGWITMDGDRPVASTGLLVLDWAPHFLDPTGERRGYVLNMFVERDYRRRGLAEALLMRCLEESKRLGLGVIALHATDAGRPVYEKLGFRSSNEMLYVAPRSA